MGSLDAAISHIEAALKAKTPTVNSGQGESSAPVIKSRCVIKPAEVATKPYLETAEDVEAFIAELRQRLDAAIAKNERIQIR